MNVNYAPHRQKNASCVPTLNLNFGMKCEWSVSRHKVVKICLGSNVNNK